MSQVFVSAGDASGDLHAAEFVRALRARRPDLDFVGMGGRAMREAGVDVRVPQERLAIGGIVELAAGVRQIAKTWRALANALDASDPALAVLVDSGGINLPLAGRIARRRPSPPLLYYVPPQVWAWRRGRLRKIARRVDRVATILPFENAHYERAGVEAEFVGHPLVDRLAELRAGLSKAGARRQLGLPAERAVVALLPGSRRNEVDAHLPLALDVAKCLHRRDPATCHAIAVAPSIERAQVDAWVARAALPAGLDLRVVEGATHELLRAADVALAKPGTGTLEAALLGAAVVLVGRANPLSVWIVRRLTSMKWWAMPNLIAGEEIVPEFIQEAALPDAIADAVTARLSGPERAVQLAALEKMALGLGRGGAAEGAARIAEGMLVDGARTARS